MSIKLIVNKITERLKVRHLLAIFDRDGTLVPINSNPKAAILDKDTLKLLLKLDSLPNSKVAILSARDLEQLSLDFKNNDLILSGNYGMELLIPGQSPWKEPRAVKARSLLLEVKEEVHNKLSEETQVILEDHKLTLCLHWHLVPPEYRDRIHSCVNSLKTKYDSLIFKTLPTSYEIWPFVQWDKSNGLIQMTTQLKLNLAKHLLLYIGDSDADEPAFAWVNNQHGITVRIGAGTQSMAKFKVKSPKDVKEILEGLIANLQES